MYSSTNRRSRASSFFRFSAAKQRPLSRGCQPALTSGRTMTRRSLHREQGSSLATASASPVQAMGRPAIRSRTALQPAHTTSSATVMRMEGV